MEDKDYGGRENDKSGHPGIVVSQNLNAQNLGQSAHLYVEHKSTNVSYLG